MPNITRTVRGGLAQAVRRLVDDTKPDGKRAILADVAVSVAKCADRARIGSNGHDGDPAAFLKAARDLERLLDLVWPDHPVVGGEGDGASVVDGSDEPDRLESALGAGPQVWDAAV